MEGYIIGLQEDEKGVVARLGGWKIRRESLLCDLYIRVIYYLCTSISASMDYCSQLFVDFPGSLTYSLELRSGVILKCQSPPGASPLI